MDGLVLARVLHVLAVVIWIGGVAFVTTVALPAIRAGNLGSDRLRAFQAIERHFAWQARTAIVIVGVTGFYMVAEADLWDRFESLAFWWMHAMVAVWLLFAIGLFVVEPFSLNDRLDRLLRVDPARAVTLLLRVHRLLLALSVITILGAVAGSHGLLLFDI
jgi:uncharacterized membrane protein